MSAPTQNNVISLKITKFPQNLLIPKDDNIVSFQAMSYINSNQTFKFDITGEHLDLIILENFNKEILFGPGETKELAIKLNPTADGLGKITITIYWMKLVEETVKIQKVRDIVPDNKLTEILANQILQISSIVDSFDSNFFLRTATMEQLAKEEQDIDLKKKELQNYPLLKQAWQTKVAEEKRSQQEFEAQQANFLQQQSLQHDVPIQAPKPIIVPEPGLEPVLSYSLEDIDDQIKEIAKGYLANKIPNKALEWALKLSDEVERNDFYYNLLRAHNSIDLDGSLKIISGLKEGIKKQDLIKKLAIDRVPIDPEQSARISMLLEDSTQKEDLMKDIIAKTIEKDPNIAMKLSYLLDGVKLRIRVLFAIAKKMAELGMKSDLSEILKHITEVINNSNSCNVQANNFNNQDYLDFRSAVWALAEAENPQAADNIIESLALQPLKEKLAMELFNYLYIMVDEVTTKLEPTVLYSSYLSFNTFVSKVTKDIQNFSIIGGNISNNLLLKNFNFNHLFLSLFSFPNFGIIPVLDRVYVDLKFNSNKSIAYYVYPSLNDHDEIETEDINNTLKQFIISNIAQAPGQIYVYNLDFIPYLGKPTIIIASDPEIEDYLIKKISPALGDTVNLIIDDSFFQGGISSENLQRIFPANKCRIINLVLSYELINDYNVFKRFIESLF